MSACAAICFHIDQTISYLYFYKRSCFEPLGSTLLTLEGCSIVVERSAYFTASLLIVFVFTLRVSSNSRAFKSAITVYGFHQLDPFVILKVFYLLALIISYKFGISFQLTLLRPRGRIISPSMLCP